MLYEYLQELKDVRRGQGRRYDVAGTLCRLLYNLAVDVFASWLGFWELEKFFQASCWDKCDHHRS